MKRNDFIKAALLVVLSLFLALLFRFSFIRQSLRGELILRPDTNRTADTIHKIGLDKARQAFEQHQARFVDARPDLFYQLGHIPGAISLPREQFENDKDDRVIASLRDKPIIVYCSGNDCTDSQILALELSQRGYSNMVIFEGGFAEWKKASLPLEADN